MRDQDWNGVESYDENVTIGDRLPSNKVIMLKMLDLIESLDTEGKLDNISDIRAEIESL